MSKFQVVDILQFDKSGNFQVLNKNEASLLINKYIVSDSKNMCMRAKLDLYMSPETCK